MAVRHLDIREDEEFDEERFADRVKQVSELPRHGCKEHFEVRTCNR